MRSTGFRWSYADNFWYLAHRTDCTDVDLARLNAGVQKAGLAVHDISLAEVPMFSELVLQWSRQTDGANSFSPPDGLFAPSHWRSGNGARQWSRVFLALSNRGALSILDVSFKFALASYLASGEAWSNVSKEQRTLGRYVSSHSDGSLRWLDVCICADASKRGSRSRFVKVVIWPRKLVVSQNGQGSREAPGPLPGRVR